MDNEHQKPCQYCGGETEDRGVGINQYVACLNSMCPIPPPSHPDEDPLDTLARLGQEFDAGSTEETDE